MKYRQSNIMVRWLATLSLVLIPGVVCAQTAEKLSNSFIPGDAIVAGFVAPNEMLTGEEWRLAPIEVLQAAGLEYVGVDPLHVESVKMLVGMPGPMGPQGGVVVELNQDFAIANLNPEILGEFQLQDAEFGSVYVSRQQPVVRLHQVDSKTILIGTGGYLPKMLAAKEGQPGQVPDLVAKISRRKGITLIAGLQQIRPMITGLLQQNARGLPPQLQGLTEFAELTDALFVNANYAPLSGSISVSAIGRDEASAENLEGVLNNAIDFGQMMATAQMRSNVPGDDAVGAAMLKYIDRLGTEITAMMRPQRKGTIVRVSLSGNVGTTGVLVGLLLPAVQAAREASRRMTASNGLKELGLSLHNYHSAYKKLPDVAIRDNDGKPLLSWRVAVLPFLGQQQLYEEFHLDEPWDSPHNIKLLDRMPRVYQDPSAPTPPGHTVFQASVGEGSMFQPTGETRFRDVLDGLSNTIMLVESSRDAAVPWTKPVDMEFDLTDPLAKLGGTHPGGFNVLLGDGAVIFIADSVDVELFRKMLTRAGKEIINERF